MERVMETVLCCTYEDEPRFSDTLTRLIQEGELPDFPKFSKENKKTKNARLKKVSFSDVLFTIFVTLLIGMVYPV